MFQKKFLREKRGTYLVIYPSDGKYFTKFVFARLSYSKRKRRLLFVLLFADLLPGAGGDKGHSSVFLKQNYLNSLKNCITVFVEINNTTTLILIFYQDFDLTMVNIICTVWWNYNSGSKAFNLYRTLIVTRNIPE